MSEKIKNDPQSPYSYLLVNKALRKIFLFTIIICTVVLSAFLFMEFRHGGNIGLFALYSGIICSVVLFFPMTEAWVYKPWQRAPQKLERHDGK